MFLIVAMLVVFAAAVGGCYVALRRRGGSGEGSAPERGAVDHEFAKALGTANAARQNSVSP
ncbi:hypothetical protein [Streptomyces longispororuber]|uniref:hypothetical protein n=1 Tax=Streptomyces longispororuber TaxID=68230 RepID=UPI0036FCF7A8